MSSDLIDLGELFVGGFGVPPQPILIRFPSGKKPVHPSVTNLSLRTGK